MSNDSKFGLKVYLRDTDAMLFAPSIDMFADTKIKLIVGNAGGTNTIVVRGRIQGQRDWDEIGSIVGNDTAEFNTKTYDFIQLECTVYDSPTNYLEVTGSGFNLASGIFESIATPAGTLTDVETLEFISSDDSVSIATVSPNKIDLTANFGGGGVVTSVNGEVGDVILDKSDVGLANVDNTSDINKPVSTAQQTALNLKQNLSEKGNPNGYASLDGGGKIPASQLPNSVMELQGQWNASINSPLLADGVGNPGDLYKVTIAGTQDLGSGSITYAVNDFVIYGADGVWFRSDSTDAVISVNGLSGVVNLTKADIGLSNVDNTSDINKPISTATQTALDLKAPLFDASTYKVGPGRQYTTIQSALNAIGDATSAADVIQPKLVLIAGGVYDEDLIIPKGRILTLAAEGTVVLGNGLGSNWSSTNTRSITASFSNADIFGASPRIALNITTIPSSDTTSTFLAQSGGFNISGDLNIAGSGLTHTINLNSVKIYGAVNKTATGLTNLQAYKSLFVGAVNMATATILERCYDCEFDALVTVDSYNALVNCEVKAGMTVAANSNTLPPSGFFFTTFFGTFTGPANSLKLDATSDYFFRTNGAVLGGAASKVLLAPIASTTVTGLLSNTDWNTFNTGIINLQGQKIIRLFQGGQYANLQAAHDAASAGDTILVGPSTSSWGDVVISKQLSIIGVGGDRNISVTIGAVSFNLTNANSNLNEVHLKDLFIAPSGATSPISVPANAFAPRIRLEQCYIYSNSGSNDLVVFSNTTSGASLYIYDCALNGGPSHSGIMLHTLGGYVFVRRSSIDGGAKGIKVDGGTTQLDSTTIEYANATEAVQVTGGTFISAVGLIRNLNAAGSGINMSSPAVVVLGNQTFDVTSGTGHCVKGTGFLLYDNVSFSDSALGASNTSFQNTLTIAPYTTTTTKSLALKAPIASPTFTGTVSGITKAMVGLGNVDNTSDATKNSAVATLTNKTIDANGTGNSIVNLEVADFAAGVIDTDLTTVSGSDNTLPSAKAVKTYVDAAVLAPTVKYIKTVALIDWGSPSGGEYTLTIPFSSHGIPNPLASCYETNGATFDFLICPVNVDASNNITIKVNETPDARFIGKIVIE